MPTKTNTKQWALTATEIAKILNEDPTGKTVYLQPKVLGTVTEFDLVLSVSNFVPDPGGSGAQVEVRNKVVVNVQEQEVLNFLSQFQQIPPNPSLFFRPDVNGDPAQDKIVITDGTVIGGL